MKTKNKVVNFYSWMKRANKEKEVEQKSKWKIENKNYYK